MRSIGISVYWVAQQIAKSKPLLNYHKSYLKTVNFKDFKIKFESERSTRILSLDIQYYMCDVICDIISYCVSSFAMWKVKCI